MVHRISAVRQRLLLVKNFELFRCAGRSVCITIQSEESRIEGGHILGQNLRRVARRIYSYKQHLQTLRLFSQFIRNTRELTHGDRTNVWAVRVAEENDNDFALEVCKCAWLTIVIGQLEVTPKSGAGNISQLKRRAGCVTSGDYQRYRNKQRERHMLHESAIAGDNDPAGVPRTCAIDRR